MAESRLTNARRNIIFEIPNALAKNLIPFITRTVMIYVLGKMYLGLNSLFTSILNVLSLAELGFGSAVVYSMYKPLAENDTQSVNALLNLYRKIYRTIGFCILIAGLAAMPFLRRLIRGEIPDDVNLYVLYLLHLSKTVSSYYLFAYKTSLLRATQRSDIISKIDILMNVVGSLLKISALLFARSFYLYCLFTPIIAISQNLLAELATRKLYPQYRCEGEVEKATVETIKKNVSGLLAHKIGIVFRNSFDSIVLSAYLGLGVLGCFNNYYYILSTLSEFVRAITGSMVAGIGNKLVLYSKKENHNDMNKFQLLYMWLISWCTVCLYCLYQPFMQIWVGKDMMLEDKTVIAFCLYFFVSTMNIVCYAYRQAAGLWWADRSRPIVEAVSNLTLNILLVRKWGVLGVLFSTIFTMLPCDTIWGSWILYKKCFTDERHSTYLLKLAYYGVSAFFGCVLTGWICAMLPFENNWAILISRGMLCIGLPNIVFLVMFSRLPEFKSAVTLVTKLIQR